MGDLTQFKTLDEYKEYLRVVSKTNTKVHKAYELLWEEEDIDAVIADDSLSEHEFVDSIALCRLNNYKKASGGANKAAENETDRLYAKNPWKFVEEFLQNADDCDYADIPEISITIDERDIQHCNIEFCYNEEGFRRSDIWAITAFSESTKVNDLVKRQEETGVFYKEKTGRKGKGFKSVFSLNAENVIVHICSNGFSFKLDNKIGRIMPVWEEDPARMDKRTHIKVELIKPEFSVSEIYPEFRRLFCIDNFEGIFSNSPFLFMHRLRMVSVTRINEEGKETFITEYKETSEKTVYSKPFKLDKEKSLLAGIAKDGVYYCEQFQKGEITTISENGDYFNIPLLRYTRMVEDDIAYRNYSIIAPVITASSDIDWQGGALFRTFPMSLHLIKMPIAIDAPFILNPDRSGIQYSTYKDEEGQQISANIWNTEVLERIFERDGVYEAFFLWLRTIEGVRVDKYMIPEAVLLFEDRNNSDGHGNTWVPQIDISSLCHEYPVFHLFSNSEGFVSFNNARIVKKDIFGWPRVKDFFKLLLGDNYEKYILSDMYVGSSLFRPKPIVDEGFTDALNSYLDLVEEDLKLDSAEMVTFFNTQLYPFLKENTNLINKIEQDAFKRLRIYLSRMKIKDSIAVVRESCSDDVKWFHSDNGAPLLSINRYRVYESSPVDIGILKQTAESVLGKKTLYFQFGGNNQLIAAKKCYAWEDVRDYIEALLHFGYGLENFKFACLKNYVLSEKFEPGFNAFRQTGVLKIIEDEDIQALASYFKNDIDETIKTLIRMGVRTGRELFVSEGNYIALSSDTVKVLESELCPLETFKEISLVKKESGKYINTTYDTIRNVRDDALIYFLDESKDLFSTDLYADICDKVQEDRRFWSRDDKIATEILIRAISGASSVLKNKESRALKVSIEDVLKSRLEKCIINIGRKKAIGKLVIENNSFFEKIPNEEIRPRLSLLKYDVGINQTAYYKGNMCCFGGQRKFLRDIQGGNIYLNCASNGDYYGSLEELSKAHFDLDALKYVGEMEQQYKDVKENIIVPIFNKADYDLNRAYNEIERRFKNYNKRQIISILSWFRSQGYTNALGNGNINNEKEIEDDYRDDPWKFIYEFIQNVDDCSYKIDKTPELNITISDADNRIIFEYNEDGFTLDDIKALTKFGDSNKRNLLDEQYVQEGPFDLEKTGRKGRGFKSVFALPGDGIVVHIYSNGFSFKFVKRLGTIIPIWENAKDVPEKGTRIVVEGFEKGYISKLTPEIRKLFGVDDISEFFAVCPIIFLRKIRKVSVINDEDIFSVNIRVKNRQYTNGELKTSQPTTAGILYQGLFRSAMLEIDDIDINISGEEKSILAVRHCFAFELRNKQRIASIFAPIITEQSNISFRKGALYNTLPLNEHVIPIPVSVNAPFETDSGRSRISENSEDNRNVVKHIFDSLLPEFFLQLRALSGIRIEKYIPSGRVVLFEGYKNISRIYLSSAIKEYDILKSYDGKNYVSCKEAIVLPDECYTWIDPIALATCFDTEGLTLIDRKYSLLPGVKKVDLNSIHFVENLNAYLDMLSIDGESYIKLMHENIYPYMSANYESIRKIYRAEGNPDAFKGMQIFIFRMSDGSYVRECADENCIWIKEVPEGYLSFGKYRSVDSGSLSGSINSCKWVEDLHEIISFNNGFTKDTLEGNGARDWTQTEELLGTVLYYNVRRNLRISFLGKCALSEELDQEKNLFREGYLATGNEGILSKVIDRNDLIKICNRAGVEKIESIRNFADSIKTMGIKQPDEFFDFKGRGIYALNSSTLALLSAFCGDRTTSGRVLFAIKDAFYEKEKNNPSATLHITYEDIKDCSPAVFSRIFEYEMVGADIRNRLAAEYCNKFRLQKDDDYAEAYIRALDVIGTTEESRSITLRLSVIKERHLGKSLQKCKLTNLDNLRLNIVSDEVIQNYPSDEIEKALGWLENDSAVSVSYEYYTADLGEAFNNTGDTASFFLFDDTKVLINKQNAENCMLKFVQRRYKGTDDSFRALISIVMEQNELKKPWKKTKREYVKKLAQFRKDTLNKQKVLFPNFDHHLNDANGKAIDYVIPELLQNINDCIPGKGQDKRTLEVAVDIANGMMLLRYDEAGFEYPNVYSITAIGQSSKHDESEGEKGLGFKKVFSLFERVEIYSNGFCFGLEAGSNTVPNWIDDKEKQEKYLAEGKTTMLFIVNGVYKQRLSGIREQWESLVNGEYVGSNISPLFLKNIDYIYLDGSENFYSREQMKTEYIFLNAPLVSFYSKLLSDQGVEEKEEAVEELRRDLKTRRKCSLMDEDEKNRYVDSISVEICVPRRITEKNRGKGCFYSTLPIERKLYATVFINVPLELTTGRDGLIEESVYNDAIFRAIFSLEEEGASVFNRLFEKIADEHRDLFMLRYIMPEIENFTKTIADFLDEYPDYVFEGFECLRIFKAFGEDELVSLASSYSVDRIIYQYIKEVENTINDIVEWTEEHSVMADDLELLNLSSVEECEMVERFAQYTGTTDGYFPLTENGVDFMLEYMSDEYGSEGE